MPEEVNRVLTDHVSDLLLCPTKLSMQNLDAEGLAANAHLVGDVMYDATLHAIEVGRRNSDVLQRLRLKPGYVVATLHRSENTDDPERLRACIDFIVREAESRLVVLPLHPRTRQRLLHFDIPTGSIQIVDPLGYIDLHRLLADASLIMTDSGGLQKEAYFHRKPCITLREETEWVETIDAGWNRLWQQSNWLPQQQEITDYGNGDSGQRCINLIVDRFGGG
jgi:UDP-GlcNAc3NAcA epimerase